MKLRNILVIVAVLTTSALTSCSKWLDVSPADEIAAEDMFKKPEGFYNVLNGIYLEIGDPSLYGGTLSWKEAEAWGNAYIIDRDVHEGLHALMNREYDNKKVMGIGETIWTRCYRNIARLNMFLEYAQQKPDEFFKRGALEKKVLMAEAYALRAYLHFDLLRVFAPDMTTDREAKRIPFVSKYRSLVNPPMASSEVMKAIREDLDLAAASLKEYDDTDDYRFNILDKNTRFSAEEKSDWGKFYSVRASHMNYFAVRILQARVALHDRDFDKAIEYAGEFLPLLKDKKIELVASDVIEDNPKLMEETLFATHFTKLVEASQDYFNHAGKFVLKVDDYQNFAKNENDGRASFIENEVLTIYRVDKNETWVPQLRMGEIYYILAEAYLMKNQMSEAVTIYNELLQSRGETALPEDVKKEDMLDFMLDDARKEFAGTGQYVFMCKRLNQRIHTSAGLLPASTLGKYVMPIPLSEEISNK